ncbi:MAG: hypothetical protein A2X34_02235 [Elusimicrobia bacterium GWC2_51_8]|nr:MAG: hypothetical protein A2X33_05290 [Elusimicrobia bacterium GWA2_51_34]OGR59656.1 MAG: hypothetical protein A2X34_02235 [Elusimicrobia bacterium GWC2_51_8]HAF95994.1 hypothetical protein [Elusimicrobiota bacterium]HCE97009.1 hypothetical protein [Elusimicrobiota bacterium]
MQYVIIGEQGFSVDISDKLRGLGVKLVSYKTNVWNVETKFSKQDLVESLSSPRLGKVKVIVKI